MGFDLIIAYLFTQPTQNPLSKTDGVHFLRCNILRCNGVKYSMIIFATCDHV